MSLVLLVLGLLAVGVEVGFCIASVREPDRERSFRLLCGVVLWFVLALVLLGVSALTWVMGG